MRHRRLHNTVSPARSEGVSRLRIVQVVVGICAGIIGARLFFLMVVQHDFYFALASGSHEVYEQLFPKRGEIYIQDVRTKERYPLAMNKDFFLMYADTRKIEGEDHAEKTAEALAEIFSYDDERKLAVYLQLLKENDPYEPIELKVNDDLRHVVEVRDLPGIGFVRKPHRLYPEGALAAHVAGFVGKEENGDTVGRYGIEGYWEEELGGVGGFVEGLRAGGGSVLTLGSRLFQPAQDGVDILLTLDRTLQFRACDELRKGVEEFGASGGALVMLDPKTGAIRAMCSMPEFNPNTYNEVASVDVYNNSAIFTAYEPGSIFKPLTMAAAMNEGAVTPDTIFHDTGSREAHCTKPIRNAEGKVHGSQTMTGVLRESVNTGMVYTVEQLGKEKFRRYVDAFGFGVKTGIDLDSEGPGTVAALAQKSGNEIDCYAATASFGQGITATPLQMAAAFGAIANGGILMKPYIVEETTDANGRTEYTKPQEVRRVLEKKTAALLSGMLVKVVDGRSAQVPGYYIAGKSGTAQIAGPGGYTAETNQSFIGFAPVDDPQFVLLVKFEKPRRAYAESTAAPVFSRVMSFALEYYGIPPSRE